MKLSHLKWCLIYLAWNIVAWSSPDEGASGMRTPYVSVSRVGLSRQGDEVVILLCGGDRSTQSRDIAAAKTLAKEI